MKKTILVFILLLFSSTVFAMEFQPVGARQLGMGGAGVASTMDVTAQYYNPAIFGFFGRETKKTFKDKDFGLNAQIGAGVRLENNLADNIDALSKIDYDLVKQISTNTGQNFTTQGYSEALKLLSIIQKIDKDQGAVTINADALLASRIKRIGIGIYGISEVNGKPYIDLVNVQTGQSATDAKNKLTNYASTISDPGQQNYFSPTQYSNILSGLTSIVGETDAAKLLNEAELQLKNYGKITPADAYAAMDLIIQSLGGAPLPAAASVKKSAVTGSIENNQTSLVANGIALMEVPLTYGHPLSDSLSIGFNVKYIQASVFKAAPGQILVFNKDSGDIVKDLDNYKKDSSNFAVDAGILFQPVNWLKLGAVGKYLNSPEFDDPAGGKVKVKPQGRAGIAINPFETLTLAADIDLTENETMNPNYKSRNLAVGLEWDILKFLALRVGAYKNLAESNISHVYTAGLGLNLWLLRLDVSAAMSSDRSRYNDKSFPEEARVQVNLSMEF